MIATTHQPTILMVDDEAVSRTIMEYYLKKSGFRPVVAESAAAARQYVADLGPGAFDCVVTDYKMPGESGLELLLWLKQNDPTLAVIMITATTEREFVAATLRGGANNFLDKPISEGKLHAATAQGVELTRHLRRMAEAERTVSEVGRTQHQLFGLGAEAGNRLEVCYHPCHAAGGDFVNYFPLGPGRFLVLAGDVSGHDLPSAFVSAYFQGMARGMIEAGRPVTDVLAVFNRFLLVEWGHRRTGAESTDLLSLCTCAVLVDQTNRTLSLDNHGMPQACRLAGDGRLLPVLAPVEGPLGWFDELAIEPAEAFPTDDGELLLWTDGLEDLANALEVTACSLATALLRAQARGTLLPELKQARDDVLVVRIHLADRSPASLWLPVLQETYSGHDHPHIDAFQACWNRSLSLALPDLPESRRYDVLLAARETVLNALRHGCAGRAALACQLRLTAQPDQRMLRLSISDPGPGHDYDWHSLHDSEDLADLHRGLALIHRLATKAESQRRGAELTLTFVY